NAHGQESILHLLPVAPRPAVYLLVTATPEYVIPFDHQTWPIPLFSQLEAEKYLLGVLSPKDVARVYESSEKLPGYLSYVRQELERGEPVDKLLSNLPKGMIE